MTKLCLKVYQLFSRSLDHPADLDGGNARVLLNGDPCVMAFYVIRDRLK